jgi:predicted transcriptional regulator
MGRRPKTNKGGLQELTPLELSLMKIVWDRGTATAAEISDILAPTNSLADTTIHTILANLRKKGYIEPVPTIERAFRFAPRVPRENVAKRSLRRIIGDFFEGSPRRLMAHLIGEEADERELEEIRKLLKHSKKKGGRNK